MDRIIVSKDSSGNTHYLHGWSVHPGASIPIASWTSKQSKAKRYAHRGLAKVDVERLLGHDFFPGDEWDLKIRVLYGARAPAAALIRAINVGLDLARTKAPKRIRRKVDELVANRVLELEAVLARLEARR